MFSIQVKACYRCCMMCRVICYSLMLLFQCMSSLNVLIAWHEIHSDWWNLSCAKYRIIGSSWYGIWVFLIAIPNLTKWKHWISVSWYGTRSFGSKHNVRFLKLLHWSWLFKKSVLVYPCMTPLEVKGHGMGYPCRTTQWIEWFMKGLLEVDDYEPKIDFAMFGERAAKGW